jgi:hypothetical protein
VLYSLAGRCLDAYAWTYLSSLLLQLNQWIIVCIALYRVLFKLKTDSLLL